MKDQDIWNRGELDSPCVRICVVHPQAQICVGCARSLEEIAGWSKMTAEARRAVLEALPGRAALLRQRRGGKRGRAARS